jgi:aminoglycoside phosphotransferase family enzyme
MLDRVIASGEVELEAIRKVADKLATFYHEAPAVEMKASAYRDRFLSELRDIVSELRERSSIDRSRIEAVSGSIRDFVRSHAALLSRRAEDGRIVDGHGDLRPEHVCLEPDPVVIDCVEFNRELRLLDPVDELSFLALECELAGGPSFITPTLFGRYVRTTGDDPPPSLIRFYQLHRAFLRARIAIWHLREPDETHAGRWVAKAERYLEAAERIIRSTEARR